MSRMSGLILAGGLILGMASSANAQVGVSIGNPYTGQGVFVGAPAVGYGYNSGYTGYVAPAAPVYRYPAYRPGAYRVYRPNYGYGYRPGFRPFRRYW